MGELQSLKVDPSAEKEKQRSEAKHILMQKQRALADLFKHLTKTGTVFTENSVEYTHLLLGSKITRLIRGNFVETVAIVRNIRWEARFGNAIRRVAVARTKIL